MFLCCFSTQSTMPYTMTDMTDRWCGDVAALLWHGCGVCSQWQLNYSILICNYFMIFIPICSNILSGTVIKKSIIVQLYSILAVFVVIVILHQRVASNVCKSSPSRLLYRRPVWDVRDELIGRYEASQAANVIIYILWSTISSKMLRALYKI